MGAFVFQYRNENWNWNKKCATEITLTDVVSGPHCAVIGLDCALLLATPKHVFTTNRVPVPLSPVIPLSLPPHLIFPTHSPDLVWLNLADVEVRLFIYRSLIDGGSRAEDEIA